MNVDSYAHPHETRHTSKGDSENYWQKRQLQQNDVNILPNLILTTAGKSKNTKTTIVATMPSLLPGASEVHCESLVTGHPRKQDPKVQRSNHGTDGSEQK